MTVLLLAIVGCACGALVALLRAAPQRHCCAPADHLMTVVAARRLRHALGKRYWLRCLICDAQLGPYDSWHVAWTEAFRTRVEARRGVRGHGQSRLPSNEVSR